MPSLVDVVNVIGQVVSAIQGRNWILVAAGLVSAAVFALRWLAGAKIPVLQTDRGGALLVLATSVLAAVGAALSSGQVNLVAILDGVVVATNAAGGYVLIRKILFPSAAPPATPGA